MEIVDRKSFLWSYLQPEIRELISDGELLIEAIDKLGAQNKVTDFSFLVFPFSKAYEGFLKKLFLDIGMIHYDDYYGDEIRIGRLLNPHYQHEKGNVFSKLCNHSNEGKNLSKHLWEVWKNGRNLVFHFFPHNYKRLNHQDAMVIINDIVKAMETSVVGCNLTQS